MYVDPSDLEQLRIRAQHYAWGACDTMPRSAFAALNTAVVNDPMRRERQLTTSVTGAFADHVAKAAVGGSEVALPDLWHEFIASNTRQPREHPVACITCKRPTWNRNGVCDRCDPTYVPTEDDAAAEAVRVFGNV